MALRHMTLRRWMVGISLAGAVSLAVPGIRAFAKPPDLPVEQGFFCRNQEATETQFGNGIAPVPVEQNQEFAPGGFTGTGDEPTGVTRTHQQVSMDARREMCADRVPMRIRQELPQIQRVNYREDVVLPAIEDAESLIRNPRRETPNNDEDMRYRNMQRRTKPLGLVPMVLIAEQGTWNFLGQP